MFKDIIALKDSRPWYQFLSPRSLQWLDFEHRPDTSNFKDEASDPYPLVQTLPKPICKSVLVRELHGGFTISTGVKLPLLL
jgi:hypothetical protein